MTWIAKLQSILYFLQEFRSVCASLLPGKLLSRYTWLVLSSLPQSEAVFIKPSYDQLCLKWASWAFSALPGSQTQSDKDPKRFIFQNWVSRHFMYGASVSRTKHWAESEERSHPFPESKAQVILKWAMKQIKVIFKHINPISQLDSGLNLYLF